MRYTVWLLSISTFFIFQSCTSSKKYNDLTLLKEHYKSETDRLGIVEAENDSLKSQLEETREQLDEAQGQLSNLSGKFLNLEGDQETLAKRFADLQREKRQLEKKMDEQQRSCREQIALKYKELEEKNTEIERLKVIVSDTLGKKPDSLLAQLSVRELQLNDLNNFLSQQEQQMAVLRTKFSGLSSKFSEADFSISEKEGKVCLTLSQKLLFHANNNQVSQKGNNVLWQIGKILKTLPDIDMVVENHTDSSGGLNLNWDISSSRAAAVAKALTSSGIAPQRITPAGRSQLDPIADDSTPEGKTLNRRTEIILVPSTNEIYQLLDNQ